MGNNKVPKGRFAKYVKITVILPIALLAFIFLLSASGGIGSYVSETAVPQPSAKKGVFEDKQPARETFRPTTYRPAHLTQDSTVGPEDSRTRVRKYQSNLDAPRIPFTSQSSTCLVLSCYYRSDSFYHGRKTPSYKWILVFIRSFLEATKGRGCGMVLFVDEGSKFELTTQLRRLANDLAHETEAESLRKMFAQRVHMITVQNNSTELDMRYLDTERWANGLMNSANNFRFALIRDWIAKQLSGKGSTTRFKITPRTKILVSDVTDVVFQRDPFSESACFFKSTTPGGPSSPSTSSKQEGVEDGGRALPLALVRFTLETKTFKNEKYNQRWMNCLGKHVTKKFSSMAAPVSCAGVTLGTAAGIQTYAKKQIELLSQESYLDCSINEVKAALDQATHNYILHEGLLKKEKPEQSIISKEEEDGHGSSAIAAVVQDFSPHSNACTFHGNFGRLVFTPKDKLPFESFLERDPTIVPQAKYVMPSGSGGGSGSPSLLPYAVVHQYTSDRHPPVMEMMSKKYLPG